MPSHDLTDYSVFVILNEEYFSRGTSTHPIEAEGRVLCLFTNNIHAEKMYVEGKILELLCDPEVPPEYGVAIVRWPNDCRGIVNFGEMVLRRTNISRCLSIWDNYQSRIQEDFRDISELRADYGGYNVNKKDMFIEVPLDIKAFHQTMKAKPLSQLHKEINLEGIVTSRLASSNSKYKDTLRQAYSRNTFYEGATYGHVEGTNHTYSLNNDNGAPMWNACDTIAIPEVEISLAPNKWASLKPHVQSRPIVDEHTRADLSSIRGWDLHSDDDADADE